MLFFALWAMCSAIILLNAQDQPECPLGTGYQCRANCGSRCSSPRFCPAENCTFGCYCKEGYAFDQQNECIPVTSDKCKGIGTPQRSCKRNEIWDCRTEPSCGAACDSYDSNEFCLDIVDECQADCYCIENYARNDRNKCIPVNSTECKDLRSCICE